MGPVWNLAASKNPRFEVSSVAWPVSLAVLVAFEAWGFSVMGGSRLRLQDKPQASLAVPSTVRRARSVSNSRPALSCIFACSSACRILERTDNPTELPQAQRQLLCNPGRNVQSTRPEPSELHQQVYSQIQKAVCMSSFLVHMTPVVVAPVIKAKLLCPC